METPGNMQGDSRFPATRWSVIDASRSPNPTERERALDTLFAAYWRPVYKYVRMRWNRPADAAQDLTQAFFAEVLDRALLAKYDPTKSRLRTYLRVCVDSFIMNENKAAKRQKRGGNKFHVALDFAAAEEELHCVRIDAAAIPSPESLDEFFAKEWMRALFGLAVEDLRMFCHVRNRENTFAMFEEYDLDTDGDTSYSSLAEKHGVPVTSVTNSLAWARREFRKIVLARLRDICGSEEEFRREARAVFGWHPK